MLYDSPAPLVTEPVCPSAPKRPDRHASRKNSSNPLRFQDMYFVVDQHEEVLAVVHNVKGHNVFETNKGDVYATAEGVYMSESIDGPSVFVAGARVAAIFDA